MKSSWVPGAPSKVPSYLPDTKISSFAHLIKEEKKKNLKPRAKTLLEKAMAWKIPRMEEPGGLQSMGSLRV